MKNIKYKPIAKSRTKTMIRSLGNTNGLYHNGISNIDTTLSKEEQNRLIEEQKYIDSLIEGVRYYCERTKHPVKVFTDNIFEEGSKERTIFEDDNILTVHPDILDVLPWYEIPEYIKRSVGSAILALGTITVDGFLKLIEYLKKYGMDNIVSEIIELMSYDTINRRNRSYRVTKPSAKKINTSSELCKLREHFPISDVDAIYYNLVGEGLLNELITDISPKLKWFSLCSEYTADSNNICDEFFFEPVLKDYAMSSDFSMKINASVYTSYLMDDSQIGRTYNKESVYVVEMLDTLQNIKTNMESSKKAICIKNWLKGMLTFDNLNIRAIMSSITFLSMKNVIHMIPSVSRHQDSDDINEVVELYNSTLQVLIENAIELLGGEDNEDSYKRFKLLLSNRMIAYDIILKEFEATLRYSEPYTSRQYSSVAFSLAYVKYVKVIKDMRNIGYYAFINDIATEFLENDYLEDGYQSDLLYDMMLTLCYDWDMSYITRDWYSNLTNSLIYLDYLQQIPIKINLDRYYSDKYKKLNQSSKPIGVQKADLNLMLPYQRTNMDIINFLIGIDSSPYKPMNHLNVNNLHFKSQHSNNTLTIYEILEIVSFKLNMRMEEFKDLDEESNSELLEELNAEFYKLNSLLTSLLYKFGKTTGNLVRLMENLHFRIICNIIPNMVETYNLLNESSIILNNPYRHKNYKLYLNGLCLLAQYQIAKYSYNFTTDKVPYKLTNSGVVLEVHPFNFAFIAQSKKEKSYLEIHNELTDNDVNELDEFLRLMKELLYGVNNNYRLFKETKYSSIYNPKVYVVPDNSKIRKEVDENGVPDELTIGLPFDKYFGIGLFKDEYIGAGCVDACVNLWRNCYMNGIFYEHLELMLVPEQRTIFDFTHYDSSYISYMVYRDVNELDRKGIHESLDTINSFIYIPFVPIDKMMLMSLKNIKALGESLKINIFNSTTKPKLSNYAFNHIFNYLYGCLRITEIKDSSERYKFVYNFRSQHMFDKAMDNFNKLTNLMYLDILTLGEGVETHTNSFLNVNKFFGEYPEKDEIILEFPDCYNHTPTVFSKFVLHYESTLVYVYSYIAILKGILTQDVDELLYDFDEETKKDIKSLISVIYNTDYIEDKDNYLRDVNALYNDAISLYKFLLAKFTIALKIRPEAEDYAKSKYHKEEMEDFERVISKFNDVKSYYESKLELFKL